MRKQTLVLCLVVILVAGCVSTGRYVEQSRDEVEVPIPELTAKEAYDMAYEKASSQHGVLYLKSISAGGTIVPHKIGEAPVKGGRNEIWGVTFEKKISDNTYSLVSAMIYDGHLSKSCCHMGEEMEVKESSWVEHEKRWLFDVSKWNLDSPEAVEIAKQQSDIEGLGTMLVSLDWSAHIAEEPVYKILLGPVSGEGGAGAVAYIDPATGKVLKTAEQKWG